MVRCGKRTSATMAITLDFSITRQSCRQVSRVCSNLFSGSGIAVVSFSALTIDESSTISPDCGKELINCTKYCCSDNSKAVGDMFLLQFGRCGKSGQAIFLI